MIRFSSTWGPFNFIIGPMKKWVSADKRKLTQEEILRLLKDHNQGALLTHWQDLNPRKKKEFFKDLQGFDLPLIFELYQEFSREKTKTSGWEIKAAPIITIPKTPEEHRTWQEARLIGEDLIRKNQVAVLIVAGGQGTRLGFAGPKGKFPISPLQRKSLFQLFAETVRALSLRHQTAIPLLVMTNRENRKETRRFFEERAFWGLSSDNVYFFDQGMLPTLTLDGQLIITDDDSLLANPDGHGGSLKALHDSGLLQMLLDRGLSELFYCQVDNPLVKIADPVFLGFHRREGAEISTKVVRRFNPEEKVGIYGEINGKNAIIEYSDFSSEEYQSRDEDGNLRYWAGNTAIHVISLPFIKRLNLGGFQLPYHKAVKEMELNPSQGAKTRKHGIKLETFVFDAIPLARRSCCLEAVREENFAPVKNKEGNDSPVTAQTAMINLHRTWLEAAGAKVSPEVKVEISPLFALDKGEFQEKLKGQRLVIQEDRYFG
jgi:UDP-N-acetylglucosamine/UDP-N-acetylgalactosamine diphosphorylase